MAPTPSNPVQGDRVRELRGAAEVLAEGDRAKPEVTVDDPAGGAHARGVLEHLGGAEPGGRDGAERIRRPGRRITTEDIAARCPPYASGTMRMTPRGAEQPTWIRTARPASVAGPTCRGRSLSTALTISSRYSIAVGRRLPARERGSGPAPQRSQQHARGQRAERKRGIHGHHDRAGLKPALERGLRCSGCVFRQQQCARMVRRHGRQPRRTGPPRRSRR